MTQSLTTANPKVLIGKLMKPEMTINELGTKFWLLNDLLHREDGPAVEQANGTKEWWLNGKLHRTDGPAIEWPNGTKDWYLNDEEVTWKQLFRNANGDLEKECRILTYALTTS